MLRYLDPKTEEHFFAILDALDVDTVLRRTDELFALLPDPASRVPVSDKSPLGGEEEEGAP